VRQILLSHITLDPLAQPRAALNTELTAEYASAMSAGEQFPPVVVFHDGKTHWLADGFHRHSAATSTGMQDIACVVKQGGLREAILHSCQANAVHGLRRSDDDKRRAVKVLLADEEWSKWSDREIARRCQVSHEFVRKLRPVTVTVDSENCPDSAIPHFPSVSNYHRTYRTKHGTIASMKTAAIGKTRSALDTGAARSVPPYAVPPHAALTVLARSIIDIKAEAEEIAVGCVDADEWEDLREACSGAAVKLSAVLAALSEPPQRHAA